MFLSNCIKLYNSDSIPKVQAKYIERCANIGDICNNIMKQLYKRDWNWSLFSALRIIERDRSFAE